MLRPPVPNIRISMLESCDTRQLLGMFGAFLVPGSLRPEYSQLPDVRGTLFSRLYLSPVELVEEVQAGEHRLGEDNERMLRGFIKADCAAGGAFVLNVITKGGMIDRSALIVIADPADLAGTEHDGTTALHLLMAACDRRVRHVLIASLGDLCTADLDAIAGVFTKDELRKVMCRNRRGRNALEVLTDATVMLEGKAGRDRNTFTTARAVRDAELKPARQDDPGAWIE